jgi:hypothetical protein
LNARTFLLAVSALLTLDACADLGNRPLPRSDAARYSECDWIRSEETRQQSLEQQAQSLGQLGASMPMNAALAITYQAMAEKNIADLQSRYAQIQCDVVRVAPTTPVVASAATAPPR